MKRLIYYTSFIACLLCLLVQQVNANPIVEIYSDKPLTLCPGDSVTLTAFICTGCAAPYTYQWIKNDSIMLATTQSIKVKSSGAYCVKVTCGGGCKVIACERVTIGFSNYSAAITNLTCYGSHDGEIIINSFASSPCRKYQLSAGSICGGPVVFPVQASNVFTSLSAGNYCVKVFDSCYGCDTCICVTITQPPYNFTSVSHTSFSTSYTWPVTGSTFTTSGVYTTTMYTASACDSVITLHLTLITPVSSPTILTSTGTSTAAYSGDHGLAYYAKLNQPNDVAYDKTKKQYFIADINNHRIRKVDSNGVITTIAGTGVAGFSGDGGVGTHAKINSPVSVAVDMQGNVYFSDQSNRRIRKLYVNGLIHTIAGTGVNGYNGENIAATSAQLSSVSGLCVDTVGNIYFTDYGNQRIRKINVNTGLVNTIAGNGTTGFSGDGGVATSAQINFPYGIYVDGNGNVFFADLNNNRIRKINSSGIISTVAGNGTQGYNGDNINAINASLFHPSGVKTDDDGNMFIADLYNHRIRKVDVNGIITTIAGNGIIGYSGDGGPSTLARLNYPSNLAFDGDGNILVTDLLNHVIRRVGAIDSPTGTKLNLGLYLQGYYAGNGLMTPALFNQGETNDEETVDSIQVELHESTSPFNVVASTSCLLYSNGNAVAKFPPLAGSYYLVLKHRNSIDTWSALPLSVAPCTACPYQEWKDQFASVYGNNLIEVSQGIFAIYTGDLNRDENIDLLDAPILENDINNFTYGYFPTDLNGDGNVDLLDSPVLETNINNFIFSNHP